MLGTSCLSLCFYYKRYTALCQTDKKSRALANTALENAMEQLVGDALCHHGGSDLQEAGAVCTDHQVALGTGATEAS